MVTRMQLTETATNRGCSNNVAFPEIVFILVTELLYNDYTTQHHSSTLDIPSLMPFTHVEQK